MDIAAIKLDLIQWLAQIQDEALLQKITSIKKDVEVDFKFSKDQLLELDRRLDKYERGEMTFSTWEAVKNRVKSKAKDEI